MSPSCWQVVVRRMSGALGRRRGLARTPSLLIATAVALMIPAAVASAAPVPAPVIYSSANDGTGFATIDPATGASTFLGASGFSSDWAAALDTDGTLWTIVNGFGAARLATVNKATGQATPVGSAIGTPMIALEIAGDGTMYGIGSSDERLYSIDKTTGVGSPIGPATGIGTTMDLAFDCAGQLWATTMGDLWTVDTATGISTPGPSITGVAEGAGSVMGLMFDQSCQMFATTYTSPGSLYAVDALGAATLVGATGLSFPHGGSIRTFVPDTVAPTTSDDVPAVSPTAPVAVTLNASDAGSGVDKTYFTVGVTPAVPTTASALYDPANKPTLGEGQRIRYFSVDLVGNTEISHTSNAVQVEVAVTPPRVATPPPAAAPVVTCTSRRVVTIHLLRRYDGHAVRAVRATINGHAAKALHRHGRFTVQVDMRGHRLDTVSVRLTVRLAGAPATTIRRAYRTCQPG